MSFDTQGEGDLSTLAERRKQHRIKARWPLAVITDQGTIQGETRNITIDGLFMYSGEPLRLNETFHMRMSPPNHEDTDFTGRVIWSDLYAFSDQNTVYGTGICFVKISERDRHLLTEIFSTHPPNTQ